MELRRQLVCVLGVLVAIAVGCVVDPHGPAASTPVAATTELPPPPVVTPLPTASATPSAAPLKAEGGCGFTVGAAPTGRTGHCTVLEIGDSLGSDLGWGLAREVAPASGLTLVQLDKSSTGLAVPSFFNWPAQLATALPRYHPALVVICLGGNDQQGMVVDNKPVQFGTTAWRTAYLARVRDLAQEATLAGAFVLWVGLPVMQQPTYDRGTRELDAAFAAGIAGLPGAAFLPLRQVFSDRTGSYLSVGIVGGAKTGLREPDGIHLSFLGENVAATYVLRQLSKLFHVALVATAPAVIQQR